MKNVVLFRRCWDLNSETQKEFDICKRFLQTHEYRTEIHNSLVVGRYSVLPYYEELEKELRIYNSRLVNSFDQHLYIADLERWYKDVEQYTPKTYTEWGNLNEGKWIVKGKTNSRKFHWNTHMFADGRENLMKVIRNLFDDSLIREQGLVVREYVPLKKVSEGINGLPITKEWRCFFYKERLLAFGYYWSIVDVEPDLPTEGINFASEVAKIISKKTNFFVLDIAEKEEGGFILIEVNDGQMSGLSCVSADCLYNGLAVALDMPEYPNYKSPGII
jgi:hypothetical protein